MPVRSVPRPARPWSHRSRADAAGSTSLSLMQKPMSESIAKRERCSVRKVNMTISLAFLAPDLVKAAIEGRLPRGMGVARLVRPARRMVSPAPDARTSCQLAAHSNRVSATCGLRFRETGFRGQRRGRRNGPFNYRCAVSETKRTHQPRQFAAIRAISGNLRNRATAWWRRQSRSNPSPHRIPLRTGNLTGNFANSGPSAAFFGSNRQGNSMPCQANSLSKRTGNTFAP